MTVDDTDLGADTGRGDDGATDDDGRRDDSASDGGGRRDDSGSDDGGRPRATTVAGSPGASDRDTPSIEPVPGEPAAVAALGDERALLVADVHAGIEAAWRYDHGVSVDSRAGERRGRLFDLVERTAPDRVVVLGDVTHSIGGSGGAERGELEVLVEELSVPLTVVKGNHDGDVEDVLESLPDVTVTGTEGVRSGDVGLVHGHTWPAREVLEARVVCVGHEHPAVRLEDSVGGHRVERAWLRGPLDPEPFAERYDDLAWRDPEVVVVPAFNDLVGSTWVNVAGQDFLSPFLPAGLVASETEAYLLDGTRLGVYGSV